MYSKEFVDLCANWIRGNFYNDEATRDVIWYHSNLKNEFNSIIENLEL